MAKGSGGTRGASGGGSSRGSRASAPVFTGGWSGDAAYTSEIQIHAINKQTEKAINVKTVVSWGDGGGHIKDLWVPKSTVGKITKNQNGNGMTMTMKKSMAQSISQQNTYKGYQMQFDFSYNT